VTAQATDASGNQASCTFTVTVQDTTPPVITVNPNAIVLTPPEHQYVTLTMSQLVSSVTDNCDTSLDINAVVITKVTSDEPELGGGDANTTNDMVIAANCKSVQLRAERKGNGDGRTYTVWLKVTDASGNVRTATKQVTVPHNTGGTTVDSGPVYTVTSSCQ
jgi:hypothetical protein